MNTELLHTAFHIMGELITLEKEFRRLGTSIHQSIQQATRHSLTNLLINSKNNMK